MEIKRKINLIFDLKITLLSFLLGPLFIFIHELIHCFFLELGGIKAHFLRFSMAAPVNYNYNISGLKSAIIYYNSNNKAVFIAAIAAPIFSITVSYISLVLYIYKKNNIYWILTINPLIFRLLGAIIKIPSFIQGNISSSDEAIAAYFCGASLTTFLWPSLILGFLCIAILYYQSKNNHRLKYTFSTILGGIIGYYLIEQLVNRFLL